MAHSSSALVETPIVGASVGGQHEGVACVSNGSPEMEEQRSAEERERKKKKKEMMVVVGGVPCGGCSGALMEERDRERGEGF